MSQQQPQVQGQIQTRNAVLVFCKDLATPLVLYFDNADKIYEDLKTILNSTEVKLLEFEPIGPIKKATVMSDKIVSIALQEEKYLINNA